MDGSDCDPDPALPEIEIQIFLVVVKLGGSASHEPIYLSRPLGVVGPTLWDTSTRKGNTAPGGFGVWIIRTA
jgi:hypothetical protein